MGKFLNQLAAAGRISREGIDEVVISAAMGKFLNQLAAAGKMSSQEIDGHNKCCYG